MNGSNLNVKEKIQNNKGLMVTSNYFVAENGVTRRSRRFSAFIGCLCDNRLGNNGNIHIVHEIEVNLHFLRPLAARLIRSINDDLFDVLVHDGLCILEAVNLGGDTDTIAAVSGGLAGVLYGNDVLPKEWLDVIIDRENILLMCCNLERLIFTHSRKNQVEQ